MELGLIRATLAVAFVVTLAGCATVTPVERPEVAVADRWNTPVENALIAPDAGWWHSFGSPELNQLIERAFAGSPDLLVAAERVFQAEQQVRVAGASLFPSLNLSGSTGERRADDGDARNRSESTSAGLNIRYEVDLWGRVRAAQEEAAASYQATAYEYDSARLSLASTVATTWFRLVALEEQLRVARDNLAIAERTEEIVDARYRNGAASLAELLRQQTAVLNQRASLEPIALEYRQTRSALAVLVGTSPLGFEVSSPQSLMDLALPMVDAGLPADLLTRRPDLASAEAQLQAADANLAQARSAWLPSVSLGLDAGVSTASLASLANPVETLGWTLSLAQNLFDGGARDAQTAISESRRRALVEDYRGAILTALQETDDALDRLQTSQRREALQRTVSERAESALELTDLRYRAGSDELLTLLDAQRTLFQTRDQLVQLRLARLQATVDLYKALGGGWERAD